MVDQSSVDEINAQAIKPNVVKRSGLPMIVWGIAFLLAGGAVMLLRDGRMGLIGINTSNPNYDAFMACGIGLAILFGGLGFVFCIAGAMRWAVTEPLLGSIGRTQLHIEQVARMVPVLSDRTLISEISKRIVFREKDRETLRQAIQEDIDKGDFEAALSLVHDMADNYGYIEESEEYRDQILIARHEDVERRIDMSIKHLQQLIHDCNWAKAFQEAAKVNRLYPDSLRAKMISKMVAQAYENFKSGLGGKISEAEEQEDVEGAYRLLRVMDIHLTQEEALPYRELAKRVVVKKREKLSVQFRLAVEGENWQSALTIAEHVIREFPNSKMAQDARRNLNELRAKVGSVETA